MPKSKATKRAEAGQRIAARTLRTAQQQLAKLDRSGHAAKRERERLRSVALLPDTDHDDDIQSQKDWDHLNR